MLASGSVQWIHAGEAAQLHILPDTLPLTAVNVNAQVRVIQDDGTLMASYPLFSAVNRCAKLVGRHQGRIVQLEYTGEGPVERTLMLVGKVHAAARLEPATGFRSPPETEPGKKDPKTHGLAFKSAILALLKSDTGSLLPEVAPSHGPSTRSSTFDHRLDNVVQR